MALVDTTDGGPMGLAVIPQDPTALDRVQDPAAVMVALVEQARTMLAQATGMEGLADVIEWKSRAEAIRVYTQQKDMGHEAELSAAEIVRRAERRIGQLIREGQQSGEVRRKGQREDRDATHDLPAPTEFASQGELSGNGGGIYALVDGVADAAFDAAMADAKAEGNLTRANVVRKVKEQVPPMDRLKATAAANSVHEPPRNLPLQERTEQIRRLAAKGLTSPQIADEIRVSADRVRDIAKRTDIGIPADDAFRNSGGKVAFRKVDPNRVISELIQMATPEPIAMAFVAYGELDRDQLDGWVSSLSAAIRSLTTIKRNLQKELTRDQL